MRIFARTETGEVLSPRPHDGGPRSFDWTPVGPLRRYVERIRVGSETLAGEVVEQVLPDGAVHLFFTTSDRPAAVAAGSACGPTTLRLSGRLDHVGVQLRPGSIAAVLGVPAAEVVGRELALERLWGPAAGALLEQLVAARPEARPGLVAGMLRARLGAIDRPPDTRVAAAVDHILAAAGNVRVRDVAAAAGVGERRLEQLFRQDVGLSPKALCRVTRFRNAIDLLVASRGDRAGVALACGFYDQAHMVNEFRELAGMPPGELARFGFFQDGLRDGG